MKEKKTTRIKTKEEHLPYELGYLTEEMKREAEKELNETDAKRTVALQELRRMIAGLWDPDEVSRDLLIWMGSHCVIHSIEDPANQVAGFTLIMDLRGLGYKHFQQLTMENIILVHDVMMHCFPGRVAGIHIVGMTPLFSAIWRIVYPIILSVKLRKRVHVHGNDMTSLHQHISPAILPEEYGGELGTFDNSSWHAKIMENNEWCLQQRLYGYQD